jgi:hypothetical protein
MKPSFTLREKLIAKTYAIRAIPVSQLKVQGDGKVIVM